VCPLLDGGDLAAPGKDVVYECVVQCGVGVGAGVGQDGDLVVEVGKSRSGGYTEAGVLR
jgi:hypothetical protein